MNIAAICAKKEVQNVIISPGSRSAPLTVAFARQTDICSRVVMDERAAGFIALGLAQQSKQPVGLVCTSGTATLNYAPAVAEAFYQQIPLLIFTADRPPEWIDQQDGQTIQQPGIYDPHVRGSFALPVDASHPDAQWHAERIISEAINLSQWPVPGPVHINAPFREPLYPSPQSKPVAPPHPKIIQLTAAEAALSPPIWMELQTEWQRAKKRLIAAGMAAAAPAHLSRLKDDPATVIIGDLIANIHQHNYALPHWDMILGTQSAETPATLEPDLLITFGGPIVSKYLKLFLRKFKPKAHWHISPNGAAIDTYQSLTRVIPVKPSYFFEHITRQPHQKQSSAESHPSLPDKETALRGEETAPRSRPKGREVSQFPSSWCEAGFDSVDYAKIWRELENTAAQKMAAFLAEIPFSEFQAVDHVLKALPEGSRLQLGNSMAVRYANFIGLAGRNIKVNSNRGTSGIDGSLSTAVGAALATDRLTTLITGDLAFFYDRNALWHNHVPKNLRVVLLNNHGGGIFKLIDGPGNLPEAELEKYFFTPHNLSARNTAADHQCNYYFSDNLDSLLEQLPKFFTPGDKPAIFEIETDSRVNTETYKRFWRFSDSAIHLITESLNR